MTRKQEINIHIRSSVLPSLLFGGASGIIAGAAVTLYKFFAGKAISLSAEIYERMRSAPAWIAVFVACALPIAFCLSRLYRKEPDLQGGGIPSSLGTLRGLFSFSVIKNAVGSFILSLVTFVLGVPLGTEGPSVQLGTALGSGLVRIAPKKWRAWERYSMTGGASSGFSTATGAPLSGIVFAIEEAHGRVSPLILLTTITAVLSAELVSLILSPILGVERALFAFSDFDVLTGSQLWMPLIVGLILGTFSVVFLKGYHLLDTLLRKTWKGKASVKLFCVFLVTLLAGLFADEWISTGHHLITELMQHTPAVPVLLGIVLVRCVLTQSANITGVTGGIFLPLLAIGAAVGAVIGQLLADPTVPLSFFVALGIVGCIAGMMKMPLTAILFGAEALGLAHNVVALILVSIIAYAIPEALGEHSVGERVLERRKEHLHVGKICTEEELEFTVGNHAFAVGKEIRDIFWPHGVQVLTVRKAADSGRLLSEGDTLLCRLSTYDKEKTLSEMYAICKG